MRGSLRSPIPLTVFALLLGLCAQSAPAADHAESPALALANAAVTGGRDINDIYIFQSPTNANNTVMIITTNPFAGANSPTTFDSRVQYEFLIDNNADAKEEITFRFSFTAPDNAGVQNFRLATRAPAGSAANNIRGSGKTGQTVNLNGGIKVRCALQDDPFFFDARAFTDLVSDGVPGNGGTAGFPRSPAHNFFGPANGVVGGNPAPNVLAITIELPSTLLQNGANTNIGFWGVTRFNGKQADRMGRPAIATTLVARVPRNNNAQPQDRRDEFNTTLPRQDQRFRQDMISILANFYMTLGTIPAGDRVTAATNLANILLPDILTFDTSNANGFLNGRKLADDVIDAELGLLINGLAGLGNPIPDNVANDSVFQAQFPYIGVPNATPQGPNPN